MAIKLDDIIKQESPEDQKKIDQRVKSMVSELNEFAMGLSERQIESDASDKAIISKSLFDIYSS